MRGKSRQIQDEIVRILNVNGKHSSVELVNLVCKKVNCSAKPVYDNLKLLRKSEQIIFKQFENGEVEYSSIKRDKTVQEWNAIFLREIKYLKNLCTELNDSVSKYGNNEILSFINEIIQYYEGLRTQFAHLKQFLPYSKDDQFRKIGVMLDNLYVDIFYIPHKLKQKEINEITERMFRNIHHKMAKSLEEITKYSERLPSNIQPK
jgi:hypothetical protein